MANATESLIQPKVSLILPAYNEAQEVRGNHFREFLNNTRETFSNSGIPHEIVVVDDGSTDETADTARSFGIEVISHPDNRNHGKGAAVKLGLLSTKGALRAFADADGSYSPQTVLQLFEALDNGADIAIANRDSHATLGRRIVHFGLEKVCDFLAPTDVADTQAGAKAFTAESVEAIWPYVTTGGYAADRHALHLVYLLKRLGKELNIAEIEAEINPVPDSHVGVIDAFRLGIDSYKIGKHTNIANSDLVLRA
jgi:glycosyltransferase involved in cell wall biosynthesis